jgi:hypothetical protein
MDRDAHPKLIDFGCAGPTKTEGLQTSLPLSRPLPAAGTPDYAAPELRDAGASPDRRADVYSLGVLAFELLTGRLPLGLDRPSDLRPELPGQVDVALALALSHDPARRPASAGALAASLAEACEVLFSDPAEGPGQPSSGSDPAPTQSAMDPEPPRRGWARPLLGVAALALLIAALLGVVSEARPRGHPRLRALLDEAPPHARVGLLTPVEDLRFTPQTGRGAELLAAMPQGRLRAIVEVPPDHDLFERAEREALARQSGCQVVVWAVIPPGAESLVGDAQLHLVDLPSYEVLAATWARDEAIHGVAREVARALRSSDASSPLAVVPTIDQQTGAGSRATVWIDAQLVGALAHRLDGRVPVRANVGIAPRLRSGGDVRRALSVELVVACELDASRRSLTWTLRRAGGPVLARGEVGGVEVLGPEDPGSGVSLPAQGTGEAAARPAGS